MSKPIRKGLDALAAIARNAEPPELDANVAASMIARALDARALEETSAHDRAFSRRVRVDGGTRARWVGAPWISATWIAVAAAALLAAGAASWAALGGLRATSDEHHAALDASSPTRFGLPSGDELAVTPGARFQILGADRRRRIRVDRGTVAFDVRPLRADESFEVVTPHLTVHVVGTVFTVESRRSESIVRVYEGHVRVEQQGAEARSLGAGEALALGAGTTSSAPREIDALAQVAERAATARVEQRTRELAAARVRPQPSSPSEAPAPITAEPDDSARARASTETPVAADPIDTHVADPATHPSAPEPARPSDETRRREALSWIASGEPSRALDAARRALAEGASPGPWRMIEGDALRANAQFTEAIDAYERAAAFPAERVEAGYLVATLHATQLSDADRALDALSRHGCTAPSSALAERALVLQAHLLVERDRANDAARVARDYLLRFPNGPHRVAMSALANGSEH